MLWWSGEVRLPRDLSGQIFGNLQVLKKSEPYFDYSWECQCVCGNKVDVPRTRLASGNTKSCGCLRAKMVSERRKIHGHTIGKKTPTYISWRNVIQRVDSDRPKDFRYYKGLGITVCDRWRSYENFLADMGEKPTPQHSIDRIDSNGNYEPSNCRWDTALEQVHNRKNRR